MLVGGRATLAQPAARAAAGPDLAIAVRFSPPSGGASASWWLPWSGAAARSRHPLRVASGSTRSAPRPTARSPFRRTRRPSTGPSSPRPPRPPGRLLRIDGLEGLAQIPTASVVVVTMGFDRPMGPAGCSGFLVPRSEGRLMTACSFASHKWPHWADEGRSVVRVSAGRAGDGRATGLERRRAVEPADRSSSARPWGSPCCRQPSDQPVARGLSPVRSGPRPPRAATGGRAAAGPAHRGAGRAPPTTGRGYQPVSPRAAGRRGPSRAGGIAARHRRIAARADRLSGRADGVAARAHRCASRGWHPGLMVTEGCQPSPSGSVTPATSTTLGRVSPRNRPALAPRPKRV